VHFGYRMGFLKSENQRPPESTTKNKSKNKNRLTRDSPEIHPRGVRSSDLAHGGSREKSPYKATTCLSAFTATSYIISKFQV
jgi:hypothetical protein